VVIKEFTCGQSSLPHPAGLTRNLVILDEYVRQVGLVHPACLDGYGFRD
jgi:hypothetical protein